MNLTEFSEKMTRKHGVKKIFREEDIYKDEREKIEEIAKDRWIPKSARKKLREVLDRGDLNKKRLIVDERLSKDYDQAIKYEMDKAIRRGNLPKPVINSKFMEIIKRARNA